MAYLKVLKGADAGRIVPLNADCVVLGRHPSCNIVLEDGAVSRQHAQILQSHGSFYAEDLRSRNGTQVNDVMIMQRTQLREGDVLNVCDYTYTFHEAGSSSDLFKDNPDVLVPALKKDDHRSALGTAEFTAADVEDDDSDRSSIISRIDVRSGSGTRLGVKAETKLRAVLEIGKFLNGVLNIDGVLPGILDAMFQIFPQADQAFVLMMEEGRDEPQLRATRNRRIEDDSMSVSRTIVNQTLQSGEAILSADAREDSRFSTSESLSGLSIRSMMCAPLVTQSGERLGVIQITTFDLRNRFTPDDLDLLVNIATQCTLAVENANLHQAKLKQRDMQRELEFAMQVQLGFLPTKRPRLPDYDFSDYYEAAHHVGGDYFDYIELPDDRTVVTVADVAGKGVPAALLMARLYSAARYHLLIHPTVAKAMSGLNSEIATSGLGHRFITCVMVELNTRTHQATIVSAGHLPPLKRDLNGSVEPIEGDDTGLPLGIIPDQEFVQVSYPMQPGDTWLLYTDGVTEAMAANREIYGSARLKKFVGTGPLEVEALIKELVANIEAFIDGQPNSDDLCIVGFQRHP